MERGAGGRWQRAGMVCAVLLALNVCCARSVAAQTFAASAVVMRTGNPTLLVDGRPFFFYGAAFFYERIPAVRWRASMLALRALGFNTLDLYVPWNWHELSDGDFDFEGRTDARRNLRSVLTLARELHFKLIVRPGPVIRNEWRNGGYPAWLLTRPEYGMPLHDVLEGRYPATATLQNANSDDAAAQWLDNATHMRYATRWLHRVLQEFAPVADLVIAVQLDDDQGAYIDNQTWPAPHLQTYLRTLETTLRDVVGPRLPVFINTYEMKVTAAAPVWAMGNWYQSDAYSIGEHDRTALEFSTGLLQTQTRFPVAISEFQAGWLAPPEDPAPRPADPTNTTLALHTLVGMGARGVIDFPAQDTVNPAGWEAPFANSAYAWDAALDENLVPSARYLPTQRFGDLVRDHGSELAGARRYADGAIAYLTSAYDETHQTNADIFATVARTQSAQQSCRAHHLVCDLVDLRFGNDATLARYPFLLVPLNPNAATPPLARIARERLARYRARGGNVVAQPPDVVSPHSGGLADATILLASDGAAFIDIVNYDSVPRAVSRTQIRLPGSRVWNLPALSVPPRDAVLLRYDLGKDPNAAPTATARQAIHRPLRGHQLKNAEHQPLQTESQALQNEHGYLQNEHQYVQSEHPLRTEQQSLQREHAHLQNDQHAAQNDRHALQPEHPPLQTAHSPVDVVDGIPNASPDMGNVRPPPHFVDDDQAGNGDRHLTLENDRVRVSLTLDAGARAFTFASTAGGCAGKNVFTTVGALRDDVALAPPLSTTDRIGKYTRSFPAGMFNRSYRVDARTTSVDEVAATLSYAAPDVVPNGARFSRTIDLRARDSGFTVAERVAFAGGPEVGAQRAVRYDSFDARDMAVLDDRSHGAVGFFYHSAHCVAIADWPLTDVQDAQLIPERTSIVLRLQFAPDRETHTRYVLFPATDIDQARALILKERAAIAAKP